MSRDAEMAALIEPHIPALRRFAHALLHDPSAADDLVQDALERAISRWHLRRREVSPRPWLFAILHNLFIDGRRRTARRGETPLDEAVLPLPDPGADPEERALWRDALAALSQLPEEQRTVLLLVGVEDFSYAEAGRLTGAPLGTVMSRLARGRQRLRRLLEGEEAPGRPALRRVK